MKQTPWHSAILLFLVLIALAACSEIADSENPPATLRESDLVGTWKADYGRYNGVDTLILRADGTFKQIYENKQENYVYETPWNKWWLEGFPDGRVRLHLKGARYYLSGIRTAEEEEVMPTGKPRPFYDPFDPERGYESVSRYSGVYMVRKLVLNVRVLPSGELVLDHMWASSQWGFGDADLFHRVETPAPLGTPAP